METICNYLLGAIGVCLLCSVAKTMGPQKGIVKELIQTLCGVAVLLAVFSPLTQITSWEPEDLLAYSDSGKQAAAEGESIARAALEAGIKQRTVAYILDKAALYGACLEVEVKIEWKETPVPAGAVISGNCSPYAKGQLTAMMEQDLGILKKDQQWHC